MGRGAELGNAESLRTLGSRVLRASRFRALATFRVRPLLLPARPRARPRSRSTGALSLPRQVEGQDAPAHPPEPALEVVSPGTGRRPSAVGAAWAAEERDWLLPMHRNLGLWTTRGGPAPAALLPAHGQGRRLHQRPRPDVPLRPCPSAASWGMISHLGAMYPVAAGLAMAQQLRGTGAASIAFLGEGATREGDFHEALSLAGVWELPAVFVVENNGYGALHADPGRHRRRADRGRPPRATGCRGRVVDGNDVLAVVEAVSWALDRARRGGGPALLEMKTFRMRGHEEASGTKYVPQELMDTWATRDPAPPLPRPPRRRGAGPRPTSSTRSTGRSPRRSRRSPNGPSPSPTPPATPQTEAAAVFAPSPEAPANPEDAPETEQPEQRFIDALSDGLRSAMEADDRTILFGQGRGRVRRRVQGHRRLPRHVRRGPHPQHAQSSRAACSASRSGLAVGGLQAHRRDPVRPTSSRAASTRSPTTSPPRTTAGASRPT